MNFNTLDYTNFQQYQSLSNHYFNDQKKSDQDKNQNEISEHADKEQKLAEDKQAQVDQKV